MPFIVDPDAELPPPPQTDTGADGILTATLYGSGGVLLSADFSGLLPTHVRGVRFVRVPSFAVRSGTDATAIGNEAIGFDHEVPVGVPSSWVAYPVFDDGTLGTVSDSVTITMPAVEVGQLWVKSVSNPTLSVLATVLGPLAGISYATRSESQNVLGSPFPVASWDVWQASSFALSFDTATEAARLRLTTCLSSGIVLLQTNPDVDFPDVYALAGDITRARYDTVHGVSVTAQEISTTFTEVARPSAGGAALYIPEYSWGDVNDAYANWTLVAAANENWRQLATGAAEAIGDS